MKRWEEQLNLPREEGYRIIEKATEIILIFNSSKELHKGDARIKEGNQYIYIKAPLLPSWGPWTSHFIQDMPTRDDLYNEIIQYLNL